MTHKEISKKLNISEGASKSNLHKAKKKIKEKIKIC
jgi:DNA-directed RNA polymerase specialized sigma24 family protein